MKKIELISSAGKTDRSDRRNKPSHSYDLGN